MSDRYLLRFVIACLIAFAAIAFFAAFMAGGV